MLILVGVSCGNSNDATSAGEATPSTTLPVVPSTDGSDSTTVDTIDATVSRERETTLPGSGDGQVPDTAAVADAQAVLVAVSERNDNVGDSYDIGGDKGCPLLGGFDGEWVAEAGGVLFCGSTDNARSVGAGLSSVFAESLSEDGFDRVVEGSPDDLIAGWCNAESCIATWTSGGIDVFVFEFEASDPSSAQSFLVDHLVEIVGGVGEFDVELVPAS